MQTTREKNATWLPPGIPPSRLRRATPLWQGRAVELAGIQRGTAYGIGLLLWPTRPDNSGFGLQRKRSTAKRLPARDGSERRQIPLPFFGAGEGSSALYKQRVS